MTDLPVAVPWFTRTRIDNDITLLLEPHVHALLRCNIWHVRGRKRDMLVDDTGLGVAGLAEAGDDLFGVDILAVATHAHTDHIGSFHEFDHRAIHAAEADVAANVDGHLHLDVSHTDEETFDLLAGWGYDVREGLLTSLPHEGFDLDGCARHGAAPTRTLNEGDVIDLGDRAFEVIHAPGHSPGSIVLWDSQTGTLFSGDAVYDGPLLDEIDTADIDTYVATMHRLREIPVQTVHAGHGPTMNRRRFTEVIDKYLKHRDAAPTREEPEGPESARA